MPVSASGENAARSSIGHADFVVPIDVVRARRSRGPPRALRCASNGPLVRERRARTASGSPRNRVCRRDRPLLIGSSAAVHRRQLRSRLSSSGWSIMYERSAASASSKRRAGERTSRARSARRSCARSGPCASTCAGSGAGDLAHEPVRPVARRAPVDGEHRFADRRRVANDDRADLRLVQAQAQQASSSSRNARSAHAWSPAREELVGRRPAAARRARARSSSHVALRAVDRARHVVPVAIASPSIAADRAVRA